MSKIEEKLKAMGIKLPDVPKSLGSYIPARKADNVIYISGQLPKVFDKFITGKIGKDLTVEQGQEAAKLAFINALAILKNELGSLDKIDFIVRMVGYINSADGFTDQASVMNGASNFAFEIFGEIGRHARLALGVNELPLNSACELEMIVKVKS